LWAVTEHPVHIPQIVCYEAVRAVGSVTEHPVHIPQILCYELVRVAGSVTEQRPFL
jgi:hypothetical protein